MTHNILLIGATGFIGQHVVPKLAQLNCRISILTRRADRARNFITLPTVEVIEADANTDGVLQQAVKDKTAVVNLAGILHSRKGWPYGPDFAKVHVALPEKIIAAMHTAKVSRLLHVSALGACSEGLSMYSRSKAAGEAVIKTSGLQWTIFQPSVVFGPEDHFLNVFARLAKYFPVLALAGSNARLQPVYVEDVAQAIVQALDQPNTFRKTFELAGPHIYTLKELVQISSLAATGSVRPILPLPWSIGKLQALFFECLPGNPLMSRDNLDSLKTDNISGLQGLQSLGITPTALEPIAAQYLAGKHPRSHYDAYRIKHRN